ncbi:ABC transporter I family member 10 isoform X2 [Gossypium hirsutum]|uniref:ABC transporter I family member 10 isoform X2 n=1 Tax=Gossypium hirsutum TaxID=3635 RepID=A0A1U8MEC2_GOSHI|nr:ABC transporter I family member 10 isoform X2 [Gossypium hirsutum]
MTRLFHTTLFRMVWLSKISRSQSAESECLVQLPPTVTFPPRHREQIIHKNPFNITIAKSSMNLSTLARTSLLHLSPLRSTSSTRHNATESVAIEGRNINFSVNTRQGKIVPILKDCSIRIPSGQLWMLLGPNGCGKSTLLKVVMPTVEADVAFGLGRLNLTNSEVRSRVSKALEAVGMSEYLQRPVQTLSGGQKQRVAIAGALAEACKVLLLDELTTFLDESDQMGVIKAVQNLLDISGEVTALWVTHRLEELEYADGAVYMEDGRVIMHGDAASINKFIKAKQSSYINRINS